MKCFKTCALLTIGMLATTSYAAPPNTPIAPAPSPAPPIAKSTVVIKAGDSRFTAFARAPRGRTESATLVKDASLAPPISFVATVKNPSPTALLTTKLDVVRMFSAGTGYEQIANDLPVSVEAGKEANVVFKVQSPINGCETTRYRLKLEDSDRERFAKVKPTCSFVMGTFANSGVVNTNTGKLSFSNIGLDTPPTCGTSLTLHATVKNEGTNQILNLPITFGGKTTGVSTKATIVSLMPGTTTELKFVLPFNGVEDDYLIVWSSGNLGLGQQLMTTFSGAPLSRSCTIETALE